MKKPGKTENRKQNELGCKRGSGGELGKKRRKGENRESGRRWKEGCEERRRGEGWRIDYTVAGGQVGRWAGWRF